MVALELFNVTILVPNIEVLEVKGLVTLGLSLIGLFIHYLRYRGVRLLVVPQKRREWRRAALLLLYFACTRIARSDYRQLLITVVFVAIERLR